MTSQGCKQTCRWGTPARIFDGPVMHSVAETRLAIKRAAKGPERARLENLLTSQACLCWSCGKRCGKAEAARLSQEAEFVNAQRR